MIIVGVKDEKFKRIAHDKCYEIHGDTKPEHGSPNVTIQVVEIPNCGHAVHVENPLLVISALRRFLTRLKPGHKLSAD